MTRGLPPRRCPACKAMHPPLTTCAGYATADGGYVPGGWAPWDGQDVLVPVAQGRERTTITLTPDQMEQARAHATRVHDQSRNDGRSTKFKPTMETWETAYVRGAAAELAASLITGLPWNTAPLPQGYRRKDKPPDIGRNVEVRNTRRPDGPMQIYDNDPRTRIALLMTGPGPTFTLRGWLRVRDCRRDAWWTPTNPGVRHTWVPCWRVPQDVLRVLPLPGDA